MSSSNIEDTAKKLVWEQEIFAGHRWGPDNEQAAQEHVRLKSLWDAAQPISTAGGSIVDGIVALEICNWNLEESLVTICRGIGKKKAIEAPIGHLGSIASERWQRVWAYYLTLQEWLAVEHKKGSAVLLEMCDPDKSIKSHVLAMLGEKNRLKELYVERFSLCLAFWLQGYPQPGSAQRKAHDAAVAILEEDIRRIDASEDILNALWLEGDGRSQPCHHKAFRRYDIVLSSIGQGKWRATMPMRGTDGFDRANILEKYLAVLSVWIEGGSAKGQRKDDELFGKMHNLLGERDPEKVFLVSLLISLLRCQALAATKRAASRERN